MLPREARILAREATTWSRETRFLLPASDSQTRETRMSPRETTILSPETRFLPPGSDFQTRETRMLRREARILSPETTTLPCETRFLPPGSEFQTRDTRMLPRETRSLARETCSQPPGSDLETRDTRMMLRETRISSRETNNLPRKTRFLLLADSPYPVARSADSPPSHACTRPKGRAYRSFAASGGVPLLVILRRGTARGAAIDQKKPGVGFGAAIRGEAGIALV
jgi:hypothetical protein